MNFNTTNHNCISPWRLDNDISVAGILKRIPATVYLEHVSLIQMNLKLVFLKIDNINYQHKIQIVLLSYYNTITVVKSEVLFTFLYHNIANNDVFLGHITLSRFIIRRGPKHTRV